MTSQASPTSSSSSSSAPHKQDDIHDDIPNLLDPNRWYFQKEQLENTPSRRCGIDADKELTYRQQSANFIQDMGQRLQVNQLCINTAIVYMHRFYMYHSFSQFHRNQVSTASIFLAAKVEEQPRKLEHVIKVAHYCLSRDNQPIDVKSEAYMEQTSELVITENILLQTLGFDVAIDHPHTHVVKCCQLVRASKDLAQTSYFMATNSLHLTTMCLQYKPTVVACVCIHLTCKWSNWEIPRSKEGRDWFWYVDQTVTIDQLEKLTTEFLAIFDKFPSRLKKKIMSLNQGGGSSASLTSYPNNFNLEPGSPGTPHYPVNRHSPGMAAGMFGNIGASSLGKRPSSSVKPSGAQVNSKQGKMIVNGGMGHPSKPSSTSTSSSHGPQIPSSSKHYPSGSKIPPLHHSSSKDSQQKGPGGHHHSSGSYHGQNRPSSSSSHSHPSGHHSTSSSLHPPPPSSSSSSSGQPNKISSQHPPGMVGSQQHTSSSKSQHNQPSKPPPNFNIKSQQPSSMPQGHPSQQSMKTSSSTVNPVSHVNKVQAALPSGGLPPPPLQQQQQQSQLPFNQIKKQPYQETLRRSTGTTSSTNSNNLNNNNSSSSSNHHQQQQHQQQQHNSTNNIHSNTSTSVGVSKTNVSVPFNSNTITDTLITATPITTTASSSSLSSSSSSRPWGENVSTGRTSSLFSPEIAENSIPPIQPFLKNEVLSPIGGDVGANSKGNGVGDFLGENNLNNNSTNNNNNNPPPTTATLFPNLTQFDYGVGGRSSSSNNNNNNTGASENSFTSGILKTIKTEDSGVLIGNNNNNKSSINNSSSNLHGGPEMMMNDGQPASTNALSSMTMPTMTTTSNNGNSNINPSSLDVSSATTSLASTYLPQMDIDNSSRVESSHKKSKKNKKEKHKHKDKDKDKEKKDKDGKKHKDKDKEKNKEEKKHKDKEKEKHKKDKHRDKDKTIIKYENPMDSSPPSSSSFLPPSSASGYPENRIKMTIPISKVENVHHHESHEKSSKSKHSSKKSSKSKSSDSMTTTPNLSIPKIKIAPVRPPSNN